MGPELGSTIFVALVSVILDRLGSCTEDGSCASLERLGLQTIKSDGSRFCVHSHQEAGRRIGEESETQKNLGDRRASEWSTGRNQSPESVLLLECGVVPLCLRCPFSATVLVAIA